MAAGSGWAKILHSQSVPAFPGGAGAWEFRARPVQEGGLVLLGGAGSCVYWFFTWHPWGIVIPFLNVISCDRSLC